MIKITVTSKDLKASKTLVENLLKVKGEKYNNWLQEKHQEFIEQNQDLILEALTAFNTEPNKPVNQGNHQENHHKNPGDSEEKNSTEFR